MPRGGGSTACWRPPCSCVETLLCLSVWGPQPAGWLWIGSQVDYWTGSVFGGIVVAFFGVIATLFLTLSLCTRLDRVWRLLRRAAGHEQREGMLGRDLRHDGDRRCARVRLLVHRDPGPGTGAGAALMRRFLDYYRQFDELPPDEISRELRARRDAENALVEQPPLDLSGAGWHEPPHAEIINAATFALRRAVNTYPDPAPLRAAIARVARRRPGPGGGRPRRGRAAALDPAPARAVRRRARRLARLGPAAAARQRGGRDADPGRAREAWRPAELRA